MRQSVFPLASLAGQTSENKQSLLWGVISVDYLLLILQVSHFQNSVLLSDSVPAVLLYSVTVRFLILGAIL